MGNNYKPGGGNKPQPYVPAGHGEKSGEYTTKRVFVQKQPVYHCYIRNVVMKCNFLKSKMVKKVSTYNLFAKGTSIPAYGTPNSVTKKIVGGYVVTERYFNEKGEAYLDIDYTCHGSPKAHPEVPHIHRWVKNDKGELIRQRWESFK